MAIRASAKVIGRHLVRVLRRTPKPYSYYQPQDISPEQWTAIDRGDLGWLLKQHVDGHLDRVCADRAILVLNAIRRRFENGGFSLLDLGCNTGFFCHFFARHGFRVTGVDTNSHNAVKGTTKDAATPVLETARRLSARYGVVGNFVDADVAEFLDSTTERYDFVLCLSLFHHFLDPGNAYAGAARCDPNQVLCRTAAVAKRAFYFEMDHIDGDRSGYREEDLPSILSKIDGVETVNVIGISVDAWRRYRNIYECLKS